MEHNARPTPYFGLGSASLLPTEKTKQDARKTRRARIFRREFTKRKRARKTVSPTPYFATYFPLARPNGENRARRKKDKAREHFRRERTMRTRARKAERNAVFRHVFSACPSQRGKQSKTQERQGERGFPAGSVLNVRDQGETKVRRRISPRIFRLPVPTAKTKQDARKTRRARIFRREFTKRKRARKTVSPTPYFDEDFVPSRLNGENRARRKKDKAREHFRRERTMRTRARKAERNAVFRRVFSARSSQQGKRSKIRERQGGRGFFDGSLLNVNEREKP